MKPRHVHRIIVVVFSFFCCCLLSYLYYYYNILLGTCLIKQLISFICTHFIKSDWAFYSFFDRVIKARGQLTYTHLEKLSYSLLSMSSLTTTHIFFLLLLWIHFPFIYSSTTCSTKGYGYLIHTYVKLNQILFFS